MPEQTFVRLAALNNAEWCDAFCRTHGIEGRFDADAWSCAVRTPPLYPDAVTLREEIDVGRLLAAIDTSEGCSIKDSFARLDLAPFGLRPLFRAEWVVRDAPGTGARGRSWSPVTSERELERWEAAWSGSAEGAGFFDAVLMADERVAVLADYDRDSVVAGAVANRSDRVVGLSNVFDRTGNLESTWLAAAATAASLWRPLPLVGYERGQELGAAHAAGFRSVGELVVWLKPAGGQD